MFSNEQLSRWRGMPKHLWYQMPAATWEEALPLGNGTLGGMVFGRVYSERIALNEDSLWYGGPMDRNNPSALGQLEEIRRLLFAGEIQKAQNLVALALSGTPESQRHYEPLGDLLLYFHGKEKAKAYRRALDLETGVQSVSYRQGGVEYRRELLVSYPNQLMAVHLTASQRGSLSFHVQLTRGTEPFPDAPFDSDNLRVPPGYSAYLDRAEALGETGCGIWGQSGGAEGISFVSQVRVLAQGGRVSTVGNTVMVEGADEATVLLAAATSFSAPDLRDPAEKDSGCDLDMPLGCGPAYACEKWLDQGEALGWTGLYQRHLEDFQPRMGAVELFLGEENSALEALPTDERLAALGQGGEDPGLMALYFHYGRYLLLSCSRSGSLPANLQGLWNREMLPPWGSKYTININTQMNYWPAEVCNLAECHGPLFTHLQRMRENGRITAEKMYGCKGFVAHHNTDIWGDTAPQDVCMSATYWPMGAAWLSLHLWESYRFSQDKRFLEHWYPVMAEAAAFFLDFMVEVPGQPELRTVCPSLSPENTYRLETGETGVLCYGASMDHQILRELFSACVAACEILGRPQEGAPFREMLERIPSPKIGKYGQIQEWMEDYEEVDPGHRHISQLFALHPGTGISPRRTPDLAEAAKRTLERRLAHGGGHTGWSRAWIVNLWARLEEGDKAEENLRALLTQSTLPNLLDNHPPFQIDGNFGGTAGIAEMLLQSTEEEIVLLPALPKAWPKGAVSGLRARGGWEVEFSWDQGELTQLALHSKGGERTRVRCGEEVLDVECSNEEYCVFLISK